MELALQRVKDAQKLAKEVPELENVCNFDLGQVKFFMNEWEEAQAHFEMFAGKHKAKSLKGWSQYMNGITYLYMGDHAEAKRCFKDVTDNARKHFTYEEFAKKRVGYILDLKPAQLQQELALI